MAIFNTCFFKSIFSLGGAEIEYHVYGILKTQ